MVFSSPIFLFVFFTVFFAVYYLIPSRAKIVWLLVSSLVFYGWGEPIFLLLMVGEILAVWLLAIAIGRLKSKGRAGAAKAVFALGCVLVLGCLAYFKYSTFVLTEVKKLLNLRKWRIAKVALPIGISFYTFQALSYLIDVYRGKMTAQRDPVQLGTYITMFPQLIAGPIVRYEEVAGSLTDLKAGRKIVHMENVWHGLQRFIVGLGKKVILANTLAAWADNIWASKPNFLSGGVIWFAVLASTLQGYYDFSGYSDMAIGLGEMMGFRFPENFNYPFISRSAGEVWRRWHITLGSWLRDYVYIPLGGSRKGSARTMLNLLIMFTLCGAWHGAAWNYVLWGVYWGVLIAIERIPAVSRVQKKLPAPVAMALTFLAFMISIVIFRENKLADKLGYLRVMFGGASSPTYPLISIYSLKKLILLSTALIGMTPVVPAAAKLLARAPKLDAAVRTVIVPVVLLVMLGVCIMLLAADTYNPFIYFRF